MNTTKISRLNIVKDDAKRLKHRPKAPRNQEPVLNSLLRRDLPSLTSSLRLSRLSRGCSTDLGLAGIALPSRLIELVLWLDLLTVSPSVSAICSAAAFSFLPAPLPTVDALEPNPRGFPAAPLAAERGAGDTGSWRPAGCWLQAAGLGGAQVGVLPAAKVRPLGD